jgi:hypothetical protein
MAEAQHSNPGLVNLYFFDTTSSRWFWDLCFGIVYTLAPNPLVEAGSHSFVTSVIDVHLLLAIPQQPRDYLNYLRLILRQGV